MTIYRSKVWKERNEQGPERYDYSRQDEIRKLHLSTTSQKFLANSQNKVDLVRFLIEDWSKNPCHIHAI